MIKSFEEWRSEEISKLTFGEGLTIDDAYAAGVQTTKDHYENEAIATHEYYDKMISDIRKQYEDSV